MQIKSIIIILTLLLVFCGFSYPQQQDTLSIKPTDTAGIHKARLIGVLTAQGGLYLASLWGLYFAWYKDYPQSSFHLFNDNNEWMQVDKCGHAITAYYVSRIGYESYKWSGVERKTAICLGGLLSFTYLLNIEILDGFSSQWGFSVGDFSANTLGSAIFVSQQLLWDEQKFVLKYSYHPTNYAQYRPEMLGKNFLQRTLKDYNGHSYWVSGNISSFLPRSSRFPKWLNIAIGYGAEGMLGASVNPDFLNGVVLPHYDRYRKFFLSVDVDLTRIPTKSKILKGIFTILSFIKIPAPAMEYNTLGQFNFHPIYF